MLDIDVIAGLVRDAYGAEPVALEPLGNDPTGERVTYRVALGDGRVWMLRGFRAGGRMPFWHGGGLAEEWLRERARVLDWLARHEYSAPRVMPARSGDPVAISAGYNLLAMTYLPGEPLPTTQEHLERLAGALGRLHALESAAGMEADDGLPSSWWHPIAQVIAPVLERLDGVRSSVPPRWQPLHAAFVATLSAVSERGDLPMTAIHGDCYPANAVETAEGQIALIDWDCAGRGPAVLDLGGLLLDAQPEPAPGEPVVVNAGLVAAAVAGYRRHREPTALERKCLLEAMRFGVAFIGSLRFAWVGEQGWSERIERSLLRLQARYAAAEEVAQLAGEALAWR